MRSFSKKYSSSLTRRFGIFHVEYLLFIYLFIYFLLNFTPPQPRRIFFLIYLFIHTHMNPTKDKSVPTIRVFFFFFLYFFFFFPFYTSKHERNLSTFFCRHNAKKKIHPKKWRHQRSIRSLLYNSLTGVTPKKKKLGNFVCSKSCNHP